MIVLITGLPLFCKRFTADLKEFDSKNTYIFLDTYNSKIAQLKFLMLLPFSKVVISLNGVSDNSGSLNWVLFWKKKLILQWMGTDSLLALERFKNKTILRKYMDYASLNSVDFQLLYDDLVKFGLKPEYLDYKFLEKKELISEYNEIKVLSYIPQSRQDFYGMNWIYNLAKSNPNFSFTIIGSENYYLEALSNIEFKGWVSQEENFSLMKSHPICLRLTEHDGCSLFVLQALAFGSEVLWTFPYENTHLVKSEEELQIKFEKIIFELNQRNLKPNLKQSELIISKFVKEKVIKNYIDKINSIGK